MENTTKNITELRINLSENYDKMKDGSMCLSKGKELSDCALRIVQTLKVELEYNRFCSGSATIKYLDN